MSIGQIIGLIVVLLLAIFGGILIVKKSKSHDLIKWISLFILVAIALTWIFDTSQGFYYSAEYVSTGIKPQGISDIPNILYNTLYIAYDKIVFLIALAVFYGVLYKSKGYQKLVATLASKFKGKEIIFALLSSFLITLMTTLFTETFAVLIFIPFLVSIALQMKLDKISTFVITFGSILVGMFGLTYGGEGLYYFNQYIGLTITDNILYRLIILVIVFILFNFFTILHIRKNLKNKNVNEEELDPYKATKVEKNARIILPVIGMLVLFVLIVLGFVAWNENFGITVFDNFHNWLIGIKIKDYEIVKNILGTLAVSTQPKNGAFGAWNLYIGAAVLFFASFVVALFGRIKPNEVIEGVGHSLKKMMVPFVLFCGVYMVMLAGYICLYMPTIVNYIGGLSSKFNPFITALSAFLSNLEFTDFSLTGYAVATYFTNNFANNINLIQLIFVTMYAFVQLCMPTSAILLIGLSYLKIEYKTWLKYIWIFAIGILIILLVAFAIMAYI